MVRADCRRKSARSAKAREMTTSKRLAGTPVFDAPACDRRRWSARARSPPGCRNAHFLWFAVDQRHCQSGRAIASGMPGKPPPAARRRARAARAGIGRCGTTASESSRWCVTICSGFANRREVVRRGSIWSAAPGSRMQLAACAAQRQRRAASLGAALASVAARPCRALMPSLPASARCRSRAFRCTSSSEIAAGVMPEMREAWPSVSGRCRLSFCCTSIEGPAPVR